MKKIICIVLAMLLIMSAVVTGQVSAATNGATIGAFDGFSSTSYILMDANSGKVLINFNESERVPVASICKLMTSLLTLEAIERGDIGLDTVALASEHACAVEGSQAFLDAGSQYSVSDLLKSVVVASANDSAIVLAELLGGTEDAFVELMNQRAAELGMDNTHYTNATGLTTADQYSTAFDTCLILRSINGYEVYQEYAKIWMDNLTHPSGRVTELVNTNRLVRYYPYCVDGKTGFTDEAGYCLSSVASKDGVKLIAVALHCKDAASRFLEVKDLFNYGFANYVNRVLLQASEYQDSVNVVGGNMSQMPVGITSDLVYLSDRTNNAECVVQYDIPASIKAPLSAGDVVGTARAVQGGEVVVQTDIVALADVSIHNLGDVLQKMFDNWTIQIG